MNTPTHTAETKTLFGGNTAERMEHYLSLVSDVARQVLRAWLDAPENPTHVPHVDGCSEQYRCPDRGHGRDKFYGHFGAVLNLPHGGEDNFTDLGKGHCVHMELTYDYSKAEAILYFVDATGNHHPLVHGTMPVTGFTNDELWTVFDRTLVAAIKRVLPTKS